MPLAGLTVWTLIGVAGAFLPPILAVWSLFIGTGFTAYLGIMLSRFTGENFLDKNKPKNVFDILFFHCVSMALLVYAIAITFFRVDYTSLPLTVGILALAWAMLAVVTARLPGLAPFMLRWGHGLMAILLYDAMVALERRICRSVHIE